MGNGGPLEFVEFWIFGFRDLFDVWASESLGFVEVGVWKLGNFDFVEFGKFGFRDLFEFWASESLGIVEVGVWELGNFGICRVWEFWTQGLVRRLGV